MSFRVAENEGYVLDLYPFAIAGFSFLDDEFAQSALGAGLQATQRLGADLTFREGIEYRSVDYRNIDSRPNLSQLDGYDLRIDASVSRRFGEDLMLTGSYRLTDRDTELDHQDRLAHRIRGAARYLYDTPFGLTDAKSRVTVSASYTNTEFDAANPTISNTTVREDDQWEIRVDNALALNEDMTLDFSASHSDRDSNLPNFVSDNTSVSIGISYSF